MGGNRRPTQWLGGGTGDPSGGTGISANELEKNASSVIQNASYEIEVNNYFQSLLRDYNDRDVESIRRHLNEIQNALENVDVINLLYGGSVSRYTYINGFSDVDVLAILNSQIYQNRTPNEVLELFEQRVHQRYPQSKIEIGNLAVTIEFSDGHSVQILPAIRTTTGVRIADPENNQWSNVIRPQNFAQKLTEVNQNNNKRVVPTIKLFKSINAQLPKEERLSGYHIESLAIEAFEKYEGSYSNKDVLYYLTKYIKDNINRNIQDSTGQSYNVDDYLGPINSKEREKRRIGISKIYRQMQDADRDRSISKWENIMGN